MGLEYSARFVPDNCRSEAVAEGVLFVCGGALFVHAGVCLPVMSVYAPLFVCIARSLLFFSFYICLQIIRKALTLSV